MTSSFKHNRPSDRPIGVFDSGLGGLSVVREIRRSFPTEAIHYFGDIARLPYGIKSKEQIIQFSIENANFLQKTGIKLLIIACNSSSSAAYEILRKKLKIPVLDVIGPAVREAAEATQSRRLGVIATQATIDSKAYEKGLAKRLTDAEVFSRSCPMFVPMVEEGWFDGPIADSIIQHYLTPIQKKKVDVLILGCTHYPLLEKPIRKFMGPEVRLVNSGHATAEQLARILDQKKLRATRKEKGKLSVFVSDKPRNFIHIAEQFLGESLEDVKVVR